MPLVVGCTLAEVLDQRRATRAGPAAARGAPAGPAPTSGRTPATSSACSPGSPARRPTAHAGRVVHRDIKPGNILVGRDHAEGVYLCDFGLARDLDVATPRQLRDGAGSPLYMAPERLLKRAGRRGPRRRLRAGRHALRGADAGAAGRGARPTCRRALGVVPGRRRAPAAVGALAGDPRRARIGDPPRDRPRPRPPPPDRRPFRRRPRTVPADGAARPGARPTRL